MTPLAGAHGTLLPSALCASMYFVESLMRIVASLFCPARRYRDEMLLGPVFFTTTWKPAMSPSLTPSGERFVDVMDQPAGGAAIALGPTRAAASEATANAIVNRER